MFALFSGELLRVDTYGVNFIIIATLVDPIRLHYNSIGFQRERQMTICYSKAGLDSILDVNDGK